MFSNLLLILGMALSLSLRSCHHPLLRKLGALGIVATSSGGLAVSGFWQVGRFARRAGCCSRGSKSSPVFAS
jgi:hypothetical protein